MPPPTDSSFASLPDAEGPFDHALLDPAVGGDAPPRLVIDSAGYIIGANQSAAQLLGRKHSVLIGDFFGIWGPELDHTELDVIRIRNGEASASSVRARRTPVDHPRNGAWIDFETLRPVSADAEAAAAAKQQLLQTMPLTEAIGLTALEIQSPELSLSFFQLPPDIRVGPGFRDMVRLWMIFFRNAADHGDGDLHIRVQKPLSGAEAGSPLQIEFFLHQPDPPPLRESGGYESTDLDEAASAVESLGGTFQLRVDYPEISAIVTVPAA